MKVHATCGGCLKTLAVDSRHAGLVIRCPVCQGAVELPSLESEVAPTSHVSRSANNRAAPADRREQSQNPAPKKRRPPALRTARRTDPGPYDSPLFDAGVSSWNGSEITDEEASDPWGASPGPPKRNGRGSARSSRTSQSSGWGTSVLPIILMIIPVAIAGIGFCFFLGARSAVLQDRQSGHGVVLMVAGMGVGVLLVLGGHLGVIVNAFREDGSAGVTALLFGLYAVWFAFTRWEKNRYFILMYVLGFVVMFGGLAIIPD